MQPTGLYNGPAFPGPFWLSHTTLLCCEIAPITAFNLQPAISSLFYGSFPRKKHRTRRLFSKNQRTSARNTNKRVESNKRTTTADDQMASEGTSNTMKPATTTPPHATQVDSRIGPNTGCALSSLQADSTTAVPKHEKDAQPQGQPGPPTNTENNPRQSPPTTTEAGALMPPVDQTPEILPEHPEPVQRWLSEGVRESHWARWTSP